ncbi:hypothetical protein INR49_000365 [Caranx melampygus]|nr:hypothetical protein INR49_000365 [Caranx melampygus]
MDDLLGLISRLRKLFSPGLRKQEAECPTDQCKAAEHCGGDDPVERREIGAYHAMATMKKYLSVVVHPSTLTACGLIESVLPDGANVPVHRDKHPTPAEGPILLPGQSQVQLLVCGRRKPRAPLTSVRLLKTTVGMDQWYMANMLSGGESKPPALLAMEPKPDAVCLKHEWTHIYFT